MSVPARAESVQRIVRELGPAAKADVYVDTTKQGPWKTAKRCWEGTPEDATHRLILQDDMFLCRDFYVGAVRALRVRSTVPVAFYSVLTPSSAERMRLSGTPWVRKSFMQGQAPCLPKPLVQAFLVWAAEQENEARILSDDLFLSKFLRQKRVPVWCTYPSLAEHGCPVDSVWRNPRIPYAQRVATRFVGRENSALSINWRVGVK